MQVISMFAIPYIMLFSLNNFCNALPTVPTHEEYFAYKSPPARVYRNPNASLAPHQKLGLGIGCLMGAFILFGCILGHLKLISAYRYELHFIDAESLVNEYTRVDVRKKKFFGFPFAIVCVMGFLLIIPYIVLALILTPVILIFWLFMGKRWAALALCKFLKALGLDLTLVEMNRFANWVTGVKRIMPDEEVQLEDLKKSKVITRKQIEEYIVRPNSRFNNAYDYLVPRKGYIDSGTYKPVAKDPKDIQRENCAICIDEFEEGSKMYVLPCHHYFHASCLAQERRVNIREPLRCPLCKLNLLRYYIYYKEHNLNPKYNKFHNLKKLDAVKSSDDVRC